MIVIIPGVCTGHGRALRRCNRVLDVRSVVVEDGMHSL